MTALYQAPTAGAAAPSERRNAPRSLLRSVGVPTEHGGWGITTEVIVLGLLVAPSAAGVWASPWLRSCPFWPAPH